MILFGSLPPDARGSYSVFCAADKRSLRIKCSLLGEGLRALFRAVKTPLDTLGFSALGNGVYMEDEEEEEEEEEERK